jgi:hypothetical protein
MVDLAKSGKFNSDCNSLPSKLMLAFSKYSPGFRFFNVIQVAVLLLRDMALILNPCLILCPRHGDQET